MVSDAERSPGLPQDPVQQGGVQSVDRAVGVLEILARDGDAGVSDIAKEMGIHKSTASRLLGALVARDLVQQNSERGKYQLGFGVLRLASSIPGRLSLVQQAQPVLRSLANEFKETVNLAVLHATAAVNVDQARGPSSLSTHDWIGSLTPLHATSSGKVLLAALDEEERSRILEGTGLPGLTPRTITSREALETELAKVTENGYAAVLEEFETGLNAVAVPVRGHRGNIVGAVSLSGPAFRLDEERIAAVLPGLKEAGELISNRMGYAGS
ncbi:IclR family transcriptional regulator [Arthrobacter sp. Br18]|uniref:IclR family transcriptional regulator n=1 Tax=Arthrobacter sp. Br18 TaxID=1312954 RepID=UPI00047C1E9D|nr:IclR family transcriptional regulator [Arthrobacter sp. Br18]